MIASSDTGVVRVWELPHRGYIKAIDEFNMFDDPHGTKGQEPEESDAYDPYAEMVSHLNHRHTTLHVPSHLGT